MTRQQLHELVDQVPEEKLPWLAELLEEIGTDESAESEKAWEDPEYVAYALREIAIGEAEIERGEGLSMEQAKQELARWLKP